MHFLLTGMSLVLSLLAFQPLQAAHLIGGEITYQCLGNDRYRFTMKIYRDCAGGGADFDGTGNAPFDATISVYLGNSPNPLGNFALDPPLVTSIDPELSNPCLIVPPNICVEEGIYVFDLELPNSDASYHIVYQRCCRNNTISNIINPGGSGTTYWMELTPEAQDFCNNSPTFNNFPPIVICQGEPIDFDFSATDADGDELVYSLCEPFLGGGTNTDQAQLPNGVAPNPDLPPPFSPVNFFNPPYSVDNPLGSPVPLQIDPNTGFITGIPETIGQFVVGVCVEEYRNGQLLSVLRRDFQFNVASCEPTVVADILEDEIINGEEFLVVSCGENTVDFINQSYQQSFINEVMWSFDINGEEVTSEDYNATVTFPGVGSYEGNLYINPGTTCGDTAEILVNIFPEIVSDFDFQYDTCLAGPVNFSDLSFSGAGPGTLTSWEWSFGDGSESDLPEPQHTYLQPGSIPISLTVEDINGCRDTRTRTIEYFPVPALIVVSPSDLLTCQPASVTFNNLSVPIDETYQIDWDFGDGNLGTGISPTHVYQYPGLFSVALEITSPIGCFTDTVFNDLIEVLPSPVAGFSYNPEEPSNFESTVNFFDESIEAESWRWTFGTYGLAFEPNPVYTFPDTGLQVVNQIVTHESGCKDTAQAVIDVIPKVTYFLPNAFTPNADGVNDNFRGAGVMEGAQGFVFQIWNRYGELVFESRDPSESWNGTKQNTGKEAPNGVYVVVVRYVEPRGKPVEINGFVALVR